MKIDIVGAMCTWTKELSTSYIIDDEILFDVPESSFKTLLNDYDLKKIKLIVISHFHSDHFIDLHLVFDHLFSKTENKLIVLAPKGCQERMITLFKICEVQHLIEPLKERVTFIDCENNKIVNILDFKIKIYKMYHQDVDSYGFIFQKDETKVGFSGDSAMCNNIRKILSKSNVAFIDSAGVDMTNKHICVKEVIELMNEYKDCQIHPVHLSYYSQRELDKLNIKYPTQGQIIYIN